MKTISKRFLISFLLMFTLIISLFAMSPLIANAANIDAGSVSVSNKSFSSTRLYYKNGADDVTNDSEDYNAYFNPETNTLTLKNYEGDAIAIGGAIQEDVTIVLIGTNIITTSDQKAISSTNGGGIFITAESEASLTINCTAGQSTIYGIYTGSWGNGVLDISGNADVTINVNSTRNDSSVYGAHINGTIDIKDNAKLTVNTSSANTLSGHSVGMGLYAKQGITFNTTKKILVNTSGIPSENGNYGIYSDDMVDLKKAEELKIVVSAGYYATPVYPAANTQNWTGFQASTNAEANVLTTTYSPIVTYTVTFNSNGGTGEMASVPVVENGTYELPTCGFTAPTGYEFKCWSVNEVEKAVEDEITITAATTVKAVWKVKSYTITFNTNGGTTIAAVTQDYNTAVQAPANPTKEGHTFKQWDKAIPATMPAENLTITAEWDINQYTITFNTDGGNAIAPITQDYGTAVVAPANPTKSGYTFTGWDKTIPSTMPAENMTITAQWTEFVPNTYTVTYTDGVDGVELFADQVNSNVTEGAATPTFNGTPVREGYTFAGWTPSVANTVTADATYTATWTINQYTITFNTDGGSTITPITQDYGTAVVAPANPTKSGYTFTGWDKTIPSTMPAENMTITASWNLIPVHEHTDADGQWESDGTYHWHTCSCTEQFDKVACSGGTATCTAKAVCTVCNNEYGNTAAHSHGSEWKTDANEHWNECACGDKANKAAHTDSDSNGKCDTCEYQMSTTPNTPDNPNNTPDNPNNTPDDPTDDKDGLGAGAIIGIVIGSVAVVGVGGFALLWFVIKKKTWADLLAVFKKK